MKSLYAISDIHIGVNRTGGTTPSTALALRKATLESFKQILALCKGSTIINGDLYDSKNINFADLWESVEIALTWLESHSDTPKLYLPRGNHDADNNAENLSSFDLFCNFLKTCYPANVIVITEPTYIEEHDAYVIPHLRNSDLFDAALANVPECTYVFLHCNYNNKFAMQADHSLNITKEQAMALPCKRIIFGHEHQARKDLGGKVFVVGNQFPTSIADCLGNDTKNMLKIEEGKLELIQTWKAEGDFTQMHWKELADDGSRFIRVIGDVAASEAGDAVSAISRFRNRSAALVITNATKVEGAIDAEELALNAEEIRAFDVRSALMEILTEQERDVVSKLLNAEVQAD